MLIKMIEIFINTDDKMVLGSVEYGSILGPDNNFQIVSIKCIREATLNEYLEFVKGYNLSHKVNDNIHTKNFYLVEILD